MAPDTSRTGESRRRREEKGRGGPGGKHRKAELQMTKCGYNYIILPFQDPLWTFSFLIFHVSRDLFLWNNLPRHIREAGSVDAFKSMLTGSRERGQAAERQAAEREVMIFEAPLGSGKNNLIHHSDVLYFTLFHDHNTQYIVSPTSLCARMSQAQRLGNADCTELRQTMVLLVTRLAALEKWTLPGYSSDG